MVKFTTIDKKELLVNKTFIVSVEEYCKGWCLITLSTNQQFCTRKTMEEVRAMLA